MEEHSHSNLSQRPSKQSNYKDQRISLSEESHASQKSAHNYKNRICDNAENEIEYKIDKPVAADFHTVHFHHLN